MPATPGPTSRPEPLGALAGRTFAAVLFDMDGTLVDSTPAVERSWVTLAQEYAIDPLRFRGFHGVPAVGILEQVLPADQRAAAFDRILALEIADTDGVVLLPGVERALRELAGVPVAIATSCTRPLAAARLAAAGLHLPVVVTVDDVARGKPAPDPFLAAAERLGVAPDRCLVVEDAPSGLAAARAAGCATLAVTTTTPAAQLEADAVVDTLDEVRWTPVAGGVRIGRSGEVAVRSRG